MIASLIQRSRSFIGLTSAAAALLLCFYPSLTFASAPADDGIEVYFSPRGGAQTAITGLIDSSQVSVRLAAYSFTSPAIVRSLLAARKRGVDVAVLVDYKSNLSVDRSGKGRAALNTLALAGVTTRTVARYAIHHDKFIVVDGRHVQTGSYNYSNAAEFSNSENVLIVRDRPQLARQYLAHWQNSFGKSELYNVRLEKAEQESP